MPKRDTPHKIKINTGYTRNNTTQDRGGNNQGAAALTPETLRNYQSPDMIEIPETWMDLDTDSTSQSLDESYIDQIMAEELSDIEADNQYLLLSDLSETEDNTTISPSEEYHGHQFACVVCHLETCKCPIIMPRKCPIIIPN